jgi:serine/threonine protein kinase
VPFTTAHERALAFAELRATDKNSSTNNNSSNSSSSSSSNSKPRAPVELHTRAPELALLVQQLAASDPAQRPTAQQLLHNPALQRYSSSSDSSSTDASAKAAALAAAQQELLAKDTRLKEQEAVIVDLRKRLSELELAASGRSNEVSLAASLAASPAVRPSDAPHMSSLQEQGLLLSHTAAAATSD